MLAPHVALRLNDIFCGIRQPATAACHRRAVGYNSGMVEFAKQSEQSLKALEQSLIKAEEDGDFEVENASGAIHISFDEPQAKFVISPNSAVNQIWISALATSFKLDWSPDKNEFVLTKTGESLKTLVARLINQHLGSDAVTLS